MAKDVKLEFCFDGDYASCRQFDISLIQRILQPSA